MKTKSGVVVMLDALGARTASIESAARYLKYIQGVSKMVFETHNEMLDSADTESLKKGLQKPQIRYFGDTVLITLEVRRPSFEVPSVASVSLALSLLITSAMEEGILFRGAVSVGDFLETRESILGPAVIDAANWYEQLEMVGVQLTPQASLRRNLWLNDKARGHAAVELLWSKYNVPTKRGAFTGHLLNWPDWPVARYASHDEGQNWFYRTFSRFLQASGSEQKYFNTERYFLDRLKDISPETARGGG